MKTCQFTREMKEDEGGKPEGEDGDQPTGRSLALSFKDTHAKRRPQFRERRT